MNQYSIMKIKKYIEDHFEEKILVEDVAREAGYSKYHLNRMFRKGTNQSIYEYIKERRLHEAAQQLLETDKAIAEIALEVGYSSQQAFTLAFKGTYECTPMVYRRTTPIFEHLNVKSIKGNNYGCGHDRIIYGSGVMAA